MMIKIDTSNDSSLNTKHSAVVMAPGKFIQLFFSKKVCNAGLAMLAGTHFRKHVMAPESEFFVFLSFKF